MTPDFTEEDVLALATLHACRPGVTNCYDSAEMANQSAWDQALEHGRCGPSIAREVVRQRIAFGLTWEDVVADSERRLAVERARDAVIEAALNYHYEDNRSYEGEDREEALQKLDEATSAYEDACAMVGVVC